MEVVESLDPVKVREWKGRRTLVPDFGIHHGSPTDTGHFKFAPLLVSEVLSCLDLFYVRSYDCIESVLVSLTEKVLHDESWEHFRTTDAIRLETVSTISSNKSMINRVKQCLSDSVSNRKRAVRDELFYILKYHSLKTSHDRRKDVPLFSMLEEISTAQAKLLHVDSSKKATCSSLSAWRTSDISKLTSDGTFPEMFQNREFRQDNASLYEDNDEGNSGDSDDENFRLNNMGIFRNEASFHLWTIFLGFNPYEDDSKVCEVSFYTVPRLDAWIATTVQLLAVSAERGGGRQKNFNTQFQTNLANATYELINNIFNFVNYWTPSELFVPSNPPNNDFKKAVLDIERESTVLVHSQNTDTLYIAVNEKWFTQYISPNCGVVHDCLIAFVSSDWKTISKITKENRGLQSLQENYFEDTTVFQEDTTNISNEASRDHLPSRSDVDPLDKEA